MRVDRVRHGSYGQYQNDAEDNFNDQADPVGLNRGFIQEDGDESHGGDCKIHDAESLIDFTSRQYKDGDAETNEETTKYGADLSNAASADWTQSCEACNGFGRSREYNPVRMVPITAMSCRILRMFIFFC